MVNPGPSSTSYFTGAPVRGQTSSPLRKKPHILKEEPGTQSQGAASSKNERVEQPSCSSGTAYGTGSGRKNRTMADCKCIHHWQLHVTFLCFESL